jgi:hypothetical protein
VAVKVVLFLLAACRVDLALPDLLEVRSVRLLELAMGSSIVLPRLEAGCSVSWWFASGDVL